VARARLERLGGGALARVLRAGHERVELHAGGLDDVEGPRRGDEDPGLARAAQRALVPAGEVDRVLLGAALPREGVAGRGDDALADDGDRSAGGPR
jgi:hypothetical protein